MRLSNGSIRWGVKLGVCALLAAAVVTGGALWADMVVTTSGVEYEGDVLADDKTMIIIQTDRGILYLNRANVQATFYRKFPNSSAKVEEITGTVEYHRKAWADDDWREAVVGMKLRPKDQIRTGDNSKVILTVAGQAVTSLEANTDMTISEVKRSRDGDVRVRLTMDVGQMWNDVGSLQSAKSRYTVETPQASCGVRGTVYTILTDPEAEETTVATIEGAVDVVQKQEDGERLTVGAGEQASLAQTGAAESAVIQAGFLSEWEGYASQFQQLRAGLQIENFFARFGLSVQQGYMVAGGGGFAILVFGVVLIRSRRR